MSTVTKYCANPWCTIQSTVVVDDGDTEIPQNCPKCDNALVDQPPSRQGKRAQF